ncbi:MAG: hypothetical protein HQL63_15905 [Magnetococcales bacterium]|nr:hypothetical protein [Magnetococcales bacterium]
MITLTKARLHILGILLFGWLWLVPGLSAASGCRIGFDIGSSGIRVGPATHTDHAKVAVDYLADVWPDHAINLTVEATIKALLTLPKAAGLPEGCDAVAGAYSAWRLALQHGNPAHTLATLRDIWQRTRVAIFIIPQEIEGEYGYLAAKVALGSALRTPFVLDIGGGSMQIVGADRGWGSDLGQKVWRRTFCARIKENPDPVCSPNPVGGAAVEKSALILAPQVASAREALGFVAGLTAISAPVVKAVLPTLAFLANERHLISGNVDAQGFSRMALASAVDLLSAKDDAAVVSLLEGCRENMRHPLCAPHFVASLVTDMLLIHAFMAGLQIERMDVAQAEITNVPGLLADKRALAWASHYDCYLRTLGELGVEAFKTDPKKCSDHEKKG